jgi:vacuolar protein sorting-associated protein 11
MCAIPPPIPAEKVREVAIDEVGTGYVLVASTDSKSGRNAVDIYDSTNKLVAFHMLLSPGHHTIGTAGVTITPSYLTAPGSAVTNGMNLRGGRSSSVVLTSRGAVVTLTEKSTSEKVALLVSKNLYSAAIVVAYADPAYEASDITMLYRRYAEHLYRKGEFSEAIDQYINTIGSLESSHVIFRYLDAPKIPLLVRYLEKLRARNYATPVHNELLCTCYLKLNDKEAAEAIAAASSSTMDKASLATILSNFSVNPREAMANICSLEAEQVAEILMVHGDSLARVLPRETAGIVVSLCVGTYSPQSLAEAAHMDSQGIGKMLEFGIDEKPRVCEPYPVDVFASAFIEHPKLLRLILSHCNRNKCPLSASLRRTLLELTLSEWSHARRAGDTEAEKLRHREAITVSRHVDAAPLRDTVSANSMSYLILPCGSSL